MSNSERKELAIITNDDAPNWRVVITTLSGSPHDGKKRYWITLEMFVRIPLEPEGQWVHHWNTYHESDDLFEATIVAKGAIRRAHEKAMALDDLSTLINNR